ncbi:MAG: tetratricopeptide repeat protein [Deltaproteobacteria bacterium]|nr:tetratricopeptide repeat protein [Deltaproteobacteria bacterium]
MRRLFLLMLLLVPGSILAEEPPPGRSPQTPCPHLRLVVGKGESAELIPGWKVVRCTQEGQRLAFAVEHPHPGRFGLFVSPRSPDTPAFATSDSFAIWYSTEEDFPGGARDVELFMKAAVERIRQHDDGTLRLGAASAPREVSDSPSGQRHAAAEAPWWLLVCTGGLYALGLLGLAALAWTCVRMLSRWSRPGLLALAAICLASALLRFLVVPFALVKVGMFHPVMDSAVGLSWLPRYGAGGPLLYHVLFQLFPVHTDTVLAFHSVLSLLAAIPMVLLARGLLRLSDGASLFLAAMLSLTPAFLRDGNSESMLVPAVFLLSGGLLLLRESLARPLQSIPGKSKSHSGDSRSAFSRSRFTPALLPAAGIVLLALCPFLRPELLLVVPALAAVFLVPDLPEGGMRRLGLCADAWVVLVAPAAVFAFLAAAGEIDKGEILLSRLTPVRLLDGLVLVDLVLRPALFPVAVPLLAVAGVGLSFRQGAWARRIGLLVVAAAWIALYSMDMNEDSMLRLHVPAAMLVAMLAAAGADGVAGLLPRRPALAVLPACALLWAASAAPGATTLFQPTDTTIQERIFLDAAELLPAEDVDLVVLGGEDEPQHALSPASLEQALVDQLGFAKVHRHYPTWRVKPPWRNDRVIPVSVLRGQGHLGRRTFFFLSSQCYAIRDAGGEEAWEVTRDPYRSIHPACRFVLTHYKLVPIHVQWMPHRPERALAFQWYPEKLDGMTVGLLEIIEPLQEPCPDDSLTRVAEWYLNEAQDRLAGGEEESAEQFISAGEDALRDSPVMLEFLASFNYWMGANHEDLARIERALAYWDRIAERNIGYPFLLSKVGAVFAVRAQFFEKEQLKQYIDRRLSDRSDDTVARYLHGLYLFYYEQDYRGSQAVLEEVGRTVPGDPRVLLYLALDHFYQGHQEEAEKLIARGVDLSFGKDPDVFYVRSIIIRSKNLPLAVEDIQRYVDMSEGKEKVKNSKKEAWLRQELERLRKGEPSDWWRSTSPDEPWLEK